MGIKRILVLLIIFIVLAFPCAAQQAQSAAPPPEQQAAKQGALWHENIFLELSGLFYFAPAWLTDFIKPEFGFRLALGYEYDNFKEGTPLFKLGGGFRFALESGFLYIKGNNQLIKEGSLVPLVLKFGYTLPLNSIFGLQADINLGLALSNISRYETASDIINNNLKTENNAGLLGGVRLYATAAPLEYLKIYAGGGTDIIFEKTGGFPLPVIEIGVSLKPSIASRDNAARREKAGKEASENIIFGR